jgi:uncharacterized protein (TIGR03067 family)
MRRRIVPPLVLALLLASAGASNGFAPAPLPRPERRPPAAAPDLTGEWELITRKYNGTGIKAAYRLEISPGKTIFVSTARGREFVERELVLRLHPRLSPPAFEWHRGDEHYVGSYRLEGDRLILHFMIGNDLGARPTDFAGESESYWVLRRSGR